jgi:hypothetical protein
MITIDNKLNTTPKPYKLHNMQGKPLSQAEVDYVYSEKSKGHVEQLVLSEDEDPYCIRRLYYCTSNGLKFEVVPTKEV